MEPFFQKKLYASSRMKKMEEGSSVPLPSADKPGQQLCETQNAYRWLESFQPFSICGSVWVRMGGGTGYVYNQAMWVSDHC